jgi:type IV pilus assembly protein PilY1
MKKLLFLLAWMAMLPALAATTQIAQVPLLNITGTGTVKPNLMLLFDNSGSMDQTYTPDYVNDNLCRSSATLALGITACNVGHPPFMSPDFNKQYYNPGIRYMVPIKADGSYYLEQNAANTSNWTVVSNDGFGARRADLFGNTGVNNINLVTGFPDVKWCLTNNTSQCQFNSASYTYPDLLYRTAVDITTGPYYYTIGVGQYCTDDTMKTCKSTTIGAAAPAGYPVPVKVRWCSDRTLLQCQGKRVGTYVYPAYSQPTGAIVSFGTIAIGASTAATSLSISNVQVTDTSNNSVTISNGSVTASTGTNSAIKQQTMASALAANIIATSNTTFNGNATSSRLYYACVRTPTGQASVPACSTFGINLTAENVVAVVPVLSCAGSFTVLNCTPYTDGTRSGWGLSASSTSLRIAPASVTFNGSTGNSSRITLSFNGNTLLNNVNLGNGRTAAQVAASVVNGIGTGNSSGRAYIGGSTNCPSLGTSSVCIIDTTSTASSGTIGLSVTNVGSLTWANTSAVVDTIPLTMAAITPGLAAPNPFVRVNIVSGQSYPKTAERIDCAGATCTYAEEMTNFANWYVYYKSRLQMMKTSVGIAFSPITANYKVGYVKLSAAGAGGAIDMKPAEFTGASRATWYTTLYNTTTSGSTPIRTAMDNVGRMFANLSPYNYAAGQEVVQYPCQPNFMILTTDGYWNGSTTNNVVNNDNVENVARFCSLSTGCVDKRAQSQPSISDVALHWYNGGSSTGTVSLRPALEPDMTKPGSVPAAAGENTHLHMNTYTLGLGVDGVMTYEPNYDTAPKPGGDFYNLITQAPSGCPWNGGGAYVWPNPDVTNTASTVQERVDDLWHAAINGHGKYFSAQDPKDVVNGLREALSNMQVRTGAAAAAATSTPNITLTDNDIFSATFTTVHWFGELTDRKIDTSTGQVIDKPDWTTNTTVGSALATRRIKMMRPNQAPGTDPVDFLFTDALMDATTKGWFANKCSILSQCTLLSAADKVTANNGVNMVNWLRGAQAYADDNIFRAYTTTTDANGNTVPIVIGDIASSKPAYVREPHNNYPDLSYSQYKSDYAGRIGTVFVGANDGMLHAFHAKTGAERWAYVPRIVMGKLAPLASITYGTNHQFSADGSPEVADVELGAGNWRTVLVAGLNAGGRGYYALDVTEPDDPKVLWEFCADPVVCPQHNDVDLGLTFGNPQFGKWRGKWVVFLTSGYNNVPGTDGVAGGSGVGTLFVVDIATGAVLAKATTSGDATTPSGLAKITAISNDPLSDPSVTYIYGGDVLGQMWRFDMTSVSGPIDVIRMGTAGATKPITTRPDVTLCGVPVTSTDANGVISTKTTATRVVLFGSGRLLDVPDTSNTDLQSLYVLKDSGTALGAIPTSNMVQQVLSIKGSSSNAVTYAVSNNQVDLSQRDGWYFNWNLNPGERMNLDPQIVSGVANVITNVPSSSSACSVGGTSNLYQIDVCTGQGVNGDPAGATLSNASAAVGFIIVRLPSGQLKLITTLADGSNITSAAKELDTAEAHRVGWRRIKGQQ